MKLDYSNPTLLRLRALGSRLGVLRPLVRLVRRLRRSAYEESFDAAFLNALRPGDTVWDVGANIGHYTLPCSERVGPSGRVLAIEPDSANFAALTKLCLERSNVTPKRIALSNFVGEASFFRAAESTVSSLDSGVAEGRVAEKVDVTTADSLALQSPPDVIKIDVESFELEVLEGASALLRSQRARAIFVEVHFAVMRNRGHEDGPRQISQMLTAAGYAITWIDPSHLRADRP